MELIGIFYLLVIITALVIQYFVAKKFQECAEEKGYDGSSYFWLCFLLGVIGYCMVAALPDLYLRDRVEKVLRKLDSQTAQAQAQPTVSGNSGSVPGRTPAASEPGTWICEHCYATNSTNYSQCKKCGQYRS